MFSLTMLKRSLWHKEPRGHFVIQLRSHYCADSLGRHTPVPVLTSRLMKYLGGDKYKEGELWSCVYDNDLETRWSGGRQFSCTDEYNLNIKPFCISQNINELNTFVCTFESPYFTLRFRTFRIRFSLPHCGFTALLFADLKDLACPDNTLYKNSW